jgi:hypothetical protein
VFNREQLSWLDKCTTGSWKYNPSTGKVDVKGTFNCQFQDLTDFKGVEFGDVTAEFTEVFSEIACLELGIKDPELLNQNCYSTLYEYLKFYL